MPAPGCTPPWPTRIPKRRETGLTCSGRPRRMNVRGEPRRVRRRGPGHPPRRERGQRPGRRLPVGRRLRRPRHPPRGCRRRHFARHEGVSHDDTEGDPTRRRPAPQGIDRSPTGSRSATGHDAKKVPPNRLSVGTWSRSDERRIAVRRRPGTGDRRRTAGLPGGGLRRRRRLAATRGAAARGPREDRRHPRPDGRPAGIGRGHRPRRPRRCPRGANASAPWWPAATSCSRRSAKGAWARSGWPSRRSRSAARSP